MDLFGFKAKRRKAYAHANRLHSRNTAMLEYKGNKLVVYVDGDGHLFTACRSLSAHYMNFKLDVRKLTPIAGIYNMHIRQWQECIEQLRLFHGYLRAFDWPEKHGLIVLRRYTVAKVVEVLEDLGRLVVETSTGRLELVSMEEFTRYETKEQLYTHLNHLLDRSHKWGNNTDGYKRDKTDYFSHKGLNSSKYYKLAAKAKTLDELMEVLDKDIQRDD